MTLCTLLVNTNVVLVVFQLEFVIPFHDIEHVNIIHLHPK